MRVENSQRCAPSSWPALIPCAQVGIGSGSTPALAELSRAAPPAVCAGTPAGSTNATLIAQGRPILDGIADATIDLLRRLTRAAGVHWIGGNDPWRPVATAILRPVSLFRQGAEGRYMVCHSALLSKATSGAVDRKRRAVQEITLVKYAQLA